MFYASEKQIQQQIDLELEFNSFCDFEHKRYNMFVPTVLCNLPHTAHTASSSPYWEQLGWLWSAWQLSPY